MKAKKKKRKECELDGPIHNTLVAISENLKDRIVNAKYHGDISDLGNEIGFVVGSTLENMSEREISDFVSGFKHGISLTNGTH